MVDRQQFLIRAHIETHVLESWIEEEWLIPQRAGGAEDFSDADLARAQLICDLKADIGANDEAVGVILHLIDQLHGLRGALRDVLRQRAAPPPD
ncbi:MAG: chaperone modulator CbpM [Methylocella sp.]